MDKKEYESPEITIIRFKTEDIITTSVGGKDPVTPEIPF